MGEFRLDAVQGVGEARGIQRHHLLGGVHLPVFSESLIDLGTAGAEALG